MNWNSQASRRALLLPLSAWLAACHGDVTRSDPPASVEAASAPNGSAAVGTVLSPSPTFVVKDADGRVLSGVPVTLSVSDGGGSLRSAPARTASNGPTTVGTWTLGTKSGRNAITVTVSGLAALTIEATGSPGPPVGLVVVSGDAQSSRAGGQVQQPLSVRVADGFGNGVPNVPVAFSIGKGGGSLSSVATVSDVAGLAGGVTWTLGRIGGAQEVLAAATFGPSPTVARFTAQIESSFDPVVRFFGTPPTAEIEASFTKAADRVHALIIGDLPDVTLAQLDVGRCGVPGVTLDEVVDDVLIYATVTTIDGPGKILGSAGPCLIRSVGRLTVLGVMRFDVDDLNNLAATGRLEPVILHEMLHIVGVGSLWRTLNLVGGSGTSDPRYLGSLATLRCNAASGQDVCGPSVPIENAGNSGTVEVHWREATFDAELMTGFAEATGVDMPLSAITAASIEDYGYAVNYLATDPYQVPLAAARIRRPLTADSEAPWELLQSPVYDVTPSGWIRPLVVR